MTADLPAFLRGWWARFYFRKRPAAPTPTGARLRPEIGTQACAEASTFTGSTAIADVEAPAGKSATPHFATQANYTRAPFQPITQPALRERTLKSLEKLQQIPALQSLAQGFLRAASRDDGSVDEVVAAVKKDPALCVRVLRMANSVFVSPEQKIEDIVTAVQMLGLRRVNTLAHALFTLREARSTSGVDWRHLWIHALATAFIAEEIQHQLGRSAGSQLHLSALLHDVGKIVLSTVAADDYRALLDKVWAGSGRIDALEAATFGVGHAEAGELFARQAGLPAEVIACIAHHADPLRAKEHRLAVAVVSIANFLGKYYGLGFSGARLDETDGDLESQLGWLVIAEETGCAPNIAAIDDAVRGSVAGLKQDLLGLRDAA